MFKFDCAVIKLLFCNSGTCLPADEWYGLELNREVEGADLVEMKMYKPK